MLFVSIPSPDPALRHVLALYPVALTCHMEPPSSYGHDASGGGYAAMVGTKAFWCQRMDRSVRGNALQEWPPADGTVRPRPLAIHHARLHNFCHEHCIFLKFAQTVFFCKSMVSVEFLPLKFIFRTGHSTPVIMRHTNTDT